MVLCWSAAASVQCRGDTRRLSDAFTSIDVYIPKSSATFPNISGAEVSICLNGHDSEKKQCCDVTLFLSPHHGKATLTYVLQELLDLGRERCFCLNAVLFELHFQWQFYEAMGLWQARKWQGKGCCEFESMNLHFFCFHHLLLQDENGILQPIDFPLTQKIPHLFLSLSLASDVWQHCRMKWYLKKFRGKSLAPR